MGKFLPDEGDGKVSAAGGRRNSLLCAMSILFLFYSKILNTDKI